MKQYNNEIVKWNNRIIIGNENDLSTLFILDLKLIKNKGALIRMPLLIVG